MSEDLDALRDITIYFRMLEVALARWLEVVLRGIGPQRQPISRELRQLVEELETVEVPRSCWRLHQLLLLTLGMSLQVEALRQANPNRATLAWTERAALALFATFQAELDKWVALASAPAEHTSADDDDATSPEK